MPMSADALDAFDMTTDPFKLWCRQTHLAEQCTNVTLQSERLAMHINLSKSNASVTKKQTFDVHLCHVQIILLALCCGFWRSCCLTAAHIWEPMTMSNQFLFGTNCTDFLKSAGSIESKLFQQLVGIDQQLTACNAVSSEIRVLSLIPFQVIKKTIQKEHEVRPPRNEHVVDGCHVGIAWGGSETCTKMQGNLNKHLSLADQSRHLPSSVWLSHHPCQRKTCNCLANKIKTTHQSTLLIFNFWIPVLTMNKKAVIFC